MRVLFWGTSEFALPPLRALVGEGFDLAGVVTQPDRPVGRSRSTMRPPPVKECAVAEGIPVLQPERPRGEGFLREIAELEPEISVVVSYGHILPAEAIALPPMGTVNVHASLLPKLRGASPIQAAIRDGFIETGVTIMRMVPALDAGPIILQARTPIAPDETAGELELRLSELGALALVEALTLLSLGQASERAQDEAAATYAGKIDRDMARVPWSEGCGVVARLIRAYDPKPGAHTTLRGEEVKLFGAMETDEAGDEGGRRPGQVLAIDADGMLVACGDGAVRIAFAQPAGKKRMDVSAWARGRGVAAGDVFGTDGAGDT
ncbi:MAG TPA: methionyl-tRNA formyltransferase [Gemmatimonadaceae bacterium]|nr:methionyl-tRNA formyltransferase [Gemmatimonadaceae bacterium]